MKKLALVHVPKGEGEVAILIAELSILDQELRSSDETESLVNDLEHVIDRIKAGSL